MKTLLFSLALAFCTSSTTGDYVYICTGPKAKVYHSTTKCKGLNKCSGTVKKITESEARKMGRRPCRVCWR